MSSLKTCALWSGFLILPLGSNCLCITQDQLAGRKSLCERGFGTACVCPVIPFGVEIHFDPTPTKDKSRLHRFGTKVLPGVFIGCALFSEGGWTGDLIIADWRDIGEQRRVRCSRRKIQVHRSWNQSIAGSIHLFFSQLVSPKTRRSPSNFTPPDSRELRRGRGPSFSFGEARSDLVQSARGDSLQEGAELEIS